MGDEGMDTDKLLDKMKSTPTVPIGMIGLIGVVAYSAYNLKSRKGALSLYLINTRVAAQSTLMATITLGLLYSMVRKNWDKLFPEKNN